MKYKMFFMALSLIVFAFGYNINITPEKDLSSIPFILMPDIDNQAQLEIDSKNLDNGVPFKYAEMIDVNINTFNSGSWEEYNDNYNVWKLHIKSDGAVGLKLLFDQFKLNKNDFIYIYNSDQSMIVGPIQYKDNNLYNSFGHQLLKGSSIYIEYFVNLNNHAINELQISNVIHAYRDIHGFYNSRNRNCGDNVACFEGGEYEEQINSVIFLEMYQYICSASLINNVNQDLNPYVLTAYHCVEEEGTLGSHNNFTFYFKHQSSSCNGNSGNYNYSRTGSVIRSWGGMSSSDFALLEMDDIPPSYFDPYYAGWNRLSSVPAISAGIHHPGGAPKKINFDNDNAYSCGWYVNNTHWCLSWDEGGTQGGSSGSPAFNINGQIIGQLSGGNSECGGTDYYGKFSTSWNGQTPSSRLKDWLNPNNENIYILDGTYDGLIDNDGDGILSDVDSNDNNQFICSDDDDDGCDDCSSGSYNTLNDGADFDNDGICDEGDEDDDNDGVLDSVDSDNNNQFICSDDDNDGCDDCSSGNYDTNNDGCNFVDLNFLENIDLPPNELAINISHQEPIAGFQFNLVDNPDCLNLQNAFGGIASDAEFTVSTNETNNYGIILGFSLSGYTIPPGNHILTYIDYSSEGECELCIENVTITNENGQDFIINSIPCINIENIIQGDINNDGSLNVIDVVIIVDNILNDNVYNGNADMNNDNILNVSDVVIIIGIILN